MFGKIKCLRTILIASFYSAITISLSDCKPSFNVESILGDDNEKSADKVTNIVDTPQLTSSTDGRAKRDWSKFNSWGKRGWDKTNFAAWGKRKWSNFASWGKRSIDPSDDGLDGTQAMPKREWSQFSSWGKRNGPSLPSESETPLQDLEAPEKRSQEELQNDMDMNKRKWSQFASWGKRATGSELLPPYKRKWSQFASWGKRGLDGDMNQYIYGYLDHLPSTEGEGHLMADELLTPEKRKWSQFASWGKRGLGQMDDIPDKRKWSQFASWGKRMDDNDVTMANKRGWAEFNSWGKRLRNARNWAAMNTWGKRRWTGLPTWGKRSGGVVSVDADTMVDKLLRYFDINEDQKLDMAELRTYIQTLMALPIEASAKEGAAQKDAR